MWLTILIVVLVVLLILGALTAIAVYHRQYWSFQQVPHESPKHLVELIREIAKYDGVSAASDEQKHYSELYRRFKKSGAPFCGFYHLLQPRVLILDRELVKQILVKNFANFNSRGLYYNARDDPLSADLWSLNGSSWQNTRLRMEPIFQNDQMRNLFVSVCSESEKLLSEIDMALKPQAEEQEEEEDEQEEEEEDGTILDIKRFTRRYVLSSIASCVFGLRTEALQSKYALAEFEAGAELVLHTRRHDVVLNALLTRYNKLARKLHFSTTNRSVAKYFMALISDVVGEREKSERHSDFLQMMIDIKKQELATHQNEEDLDPKQLSQHLNNELAADLIGFLKTGFEPTANALAFALYELALNLWVQDRARREVVDTLARHNRELSFEAVHEMKYLGQVISETIRLHPIVPFLVRRTLTDYHVPSQSKYVIRKNMYVIIPTHAMHNDPENFAEPLQFKPERFAKQENKSREQCLWLGFGEGPRCCIGVRFAQLQIRVALAQLLRKYRFSLSAKRVLHENDAGMHLRVEPLDSESGGSTANKRLI